MNKEELLNFRRNYMEARNKRRNIFDEDKCYLNEAVSKTKIKKENSNNIVVYEGTYNKDKFGLSITFDDDLNASFKQFRDIETKELYLVSLNELDSFYKEHIIVNCNVNIVNIDIYDKSYDDTRETFFKGVLEESQDKVILKLIRKDYN
ncbi:MAG: hypothetical protein IIZ40_02850 [Bacilli bacterium]|nr:hypothetical protein [Bacilli bacterium]